MTWNLIEKTVLGVIFYFASAPEGHASEIKGLY